MLCLIPITAFLNIGTSVTQKIDFEDDAVAEVIDSIEEFNEAPVFGLIRTMGGEFLTGELTTVIGMMYLQQQQFQEIQFLLLPYLMILMERE